MKLSLTTKLINNHMFKLIQKKNKRKYFLNKSLSQILKNFFNLKKDNLKIAMKIHTDLLQKKNIKNNKQIFMDIISEALSIQVGIPFLENINISEKCSVEK